MGAPALHRFNVTEYYRMAEVGVLAPDARVEFIDGQVIDCFRVTPLHAGVKRAVARPFFELPKTSCIVSAGDPLHVDEYNEVQPDVMLVKYREDYYKERHPQPADVFILMEVADESLDFDRRVKLPLYGRVGIPEVWIVNLPAQIIEVYRQPNFTGYSSKNVLRAGDQTSPLSFPDVFLDVSELMIIIA